MAELLIASALAIALLMVLTWLISLIVSNASIVDIVWGFGFVTAVWTAFLVAGDPTAHGVLITVLVTVWGIRLTAYLAWRNLGKPEDYRYQQMRAKAPESFWIVSLFKVFLLQGVLMWLVAVPAVVIQSDTGSIGWLELTGAVIWIVGFFFESVGDFQLARFKAQPDSKGRVMNQGLWRYTRHPNYFGDFCVWWGVYLIAAGGGAWWTVFSPLIMSILLIRVSGAGLLEKTISDRRPEYVDYIATTNAFFPGPARHPD